MMHQKLEHGRMRQTAAKAALALAVSAMPLLSHVPEAKAINNPRFSYYDSGQCIAPDSFALLKDSVSCHAEGQTVVYQNFMGITKRIDSFSKYGEIITPDNISCNDQDLFVRTNKSFVLIRFFDRISEENQRYGLEAYAWRPDAAARLIERGIRSWACSRTECYFLMNAGRIISIPVKYNPQLDIDPPSFMNELPLVGDVAKAKLTIFANSIFAAPLDDKLAVIRLPLGTGSIYYSLAPAPPVQGFTGFAFSERGAQLFLTLSEHGRTQIKLAHLCGRSLFMDVAAEESSGQR